MERDYFILAIVGAFLAIGSIVLFLGDFDIFKTATDDISSGRAYIDSVEVRMLESFPVQVRALIKGNLSDACTRIKEIKRKRDGDTFTVTFLTARPENIVCAQVLTPFEQNIPLEVEGLSAGTYTVKSGNAKDSFTLRLDNRAPVTGLRIGDHAIYMEDQQPAPVVLVNLAHFRDGGYVVIHKDDGGSLGDILGSSSLLPKGDNFNIGVELLRTTLQNEALWAALYEGNEGEFNPAINNPIKDNNGNVFKMRFKTYKGASGSDAINL